MRSVLTVIGALIATSCAVWSQGFDWQWSPRSPMTMPTRYVGVELGGGVSLHQATLPYIEDLVPCCSFSSGTGVPLRIAVFVEDWWKPSTAVALSGGVTMHQSQFTAQAEPLPDSGGREIVTEYLFDATLTYLTVGGGIRQRLFKSFLSVGVDLRASVNVAQSYQLLERVVSPDDYFLKTNPPSKEQSWEPTVVDRAAVLVLEPSVTVQYDIALGMGLVISPLVQVGVPIFDLAPDASWRYVAVTGGVRLSRGL